MTRQTENAGWKIEAAGSGMKRVVRDGEIVGLAVELMDGTWSAADTNGNRYPDLVRNTPTQVKNWFRDRASGGRDE